MLAVNLGLATFVSNQREMWARFGFMNRGKENRVEPTDVCLLLRTTNRSILARRWNHECDL